MFDFNSLTLGEVAIIEDLSRQSIGSIADEDSPKGNALAAIVMVIKRRQGEPGFKFNDALALPLSEANALLAPASEEEEEEAGEEPASVKRATK